MKTRTKFILTTVPIVLVLMLFHPGGPLGATLWPQPEPGSPEPESWQMPLLVLLALFESTATAVGIAYLFYGWHWTRSVMPERPALATALHLSIAFALIQWWPHGNLHISVPFSFGSIIAIDYGFHVPLLVSSAIILGSVAYVGRRSMKQAADDRAQAVDVARDVGSPENS